MKTMTWKLSRILVFLVSSILITRPLDASTPTNYLVTTLAHPSNLVDGSATNARFCLFFLPSKVAVDVGGNVYVADSGNFAIRKISSNGVVTTLAGNGEWGFSNGIGTNATFKGPTGVAVDVGGNVYVADSIDCAIARSVAMEW
jgi:hypothetical protein